MTAATAAAMVVLVVLWWFLLWSPREHAYDRARAAAQAEQATVQQLQAQLSQLKAQQAQSEQPANKARLATEEAAIPAQPDLPQLILQVNTASEQAGVNFLSISPAEPTAASSTTGSAAVPYPMNISLSITGGYYQLLDFINRLDTLPRLLVVSGTSVSTSGGSGAELTVSLTLKAFTSQPYTGLPGSGTASSTTTTTAAPGGSPTTTVPVTTTVAP